MAEIAALIDLYDKAIEKFEFVSAHALNMHDMMCVYLDGKIDCSSFSGK